MGLTILARLLSFYNRKKNIQLNSFAMRRTLELIFGIRAPLEIEIYSLLFCYEDSITIATRKTFLTLQFEGVQNSYLVHRSL